MSQTSTAPVLLVVDDDREIRNLLSDHLEQHGFRTVKAADGRAMKAALLFYMKSLARHVAPKGIRANVVSPGTTYFKGGFWNDV